MKSPTDGATARLAQFIVASRREDVPGNALDAARRSVFDSIGVMLAGAVEPPARIVQRLAVEDGASPRCAILGTPLRTSSTWAALANGTAGHALDFDDTNFAMMGHPSVPVLAAALAAAEPRPASGLAFLHAFLLGFEVETALGEVVNPEQYRRGFHTTCSLGTLGAAAASARLLELDAIQTRHAIAIAASQASGLKENLGTMAKPFHAGHAARSGLLAALLAREGFTGSTVAVEGQQGYLRVLGAKTDDPTAALERLGDPWKILASGVAVKLYPSCAATHALIDAVLDLRTANHLRPEEIGEIVYGAAPAVPSLLIYHSPRTGLEGKFSAEFCAAAALVDGEIGVATFTDEKVADPRIRALMEKVRLTVDPTIPPDGKRDAWGRITVTLTDGRALEVPPREIRGHPRLPLSADALRGKFNQCAAVTLPPQRVSAGARILETLDACSDLRELITVLAPSER